MVMNSDEQSARAEGVPGGESEDVETAQSIDAAELLREVEQHPFVDPDQFETGVGVLRKKYTDHFRLPPDATGEQIMSAYELTYLVDLKSKAKVGADALDVYERSAEERPLDYRQRQEVINTLVSPLNKLYYNERGDEVSLGEYLQDYYRGLGVNVLIRYDTIPERAKTAIIRRLIGSDEQLTERDFDYLQKDDVPIPMLEIQKGDETVTVPLLGGDRDATMTVRSSGFNEDTGEKIERTEGNAVSFNVSRQPELGSTVHKIIGSIVHEVDHAVRTALDDQEIFKKEQRIVSEGTAEMAKYSFGRIQTKRMPYSGFDYKAQLTYGLSARAEGERTGTHELSVEHTYASGYVLASHLREKYGDGVFWSTLYDKRKAIPEQDVSVLRRSIGAKLRFNKDQFEKAIYQLLDK